MRLDPAGSALGIRDREPRHVIAIVYSVGSIYITSKVGIANVPGTVIDGALEDVSIISHELHPNEGRSTIGSLSFSVVDVAGSLTDSIRDQLFDELDGVRTNEVRYFTGDTDDFDDTTWRRITTQTVQTAVEYDQGSYRFTCADRLRELRDSLFDGPKTRITTSLEITDTVITVADTSEFSMLEHTAAFTDAPLETVGYLLISKTGEIVRYTSKSATEFLGCTREVGNTIATKIEIADGTEDDRLPEIREFQYYEGSAVQLLYGFMTGTLLGTSITLPASDNLGVSTSFVDTDSFTNIGEDLYNPSNFDDGFVLRFLHLTKVDGKQFIEEQLLLPMGCFFAITPEGKLQLRRAPRMLAGASPVTVLSHDDVISHGSLRHDLSQLINQLVIRWNWDGDTFTRETVLTNAGSISAHGLGESATRELQGLTVQRHTGQTLRRIFDGLTDRYGAPPLTIPVKVSARHNALEVGDVVRLVLPDVRDYAAASTLDRSFQITAIGMNWVTGDLDLDLFGSSALVLPDQPEVDTTPLSDAWYVSQGTPLSSALTIVDGAVTAGGTLTGDADMRASAATYYYEGNLTINGGVTVLVTQNVQLRVRGTLTVNGLIDGVGRGIAHITDPNIVGNAYVTPSEWTEQTLGSTRGGAGLAYQELVAGASSLHIAVTQLTQQGLAALPVPALSVENGFLVGVPGEARGTPGQYGAPIIDMVGKIVRGLGGDGGEGGAGLLVVCRGLTFGVNGEIDLSGEPGNTGQTGDYVLNGNTLRPGTGGGGAAGGLYVLLDDTTAVLPDLAGHFTANHGSTVQSGTPIETALGGGDGATWTGFDPGIGSADNWDSSNMVRWVPVEEQLGEGSSEVVPAPVILSVVGTDFGITITFEALPEAEYDLIELFASITNDRADATRVARIRAPFYNHTFDGIHTRYYWARAIQGARKSEWSSAADDGVIGTGGTVQAASDAWRENFEAYTTREDFERKWEIVAGDPTISFPTVGQDGGKAIEVVGYMKAVWRDSIPYDHVGLYEAWARFRLTVSESGNSRCSLGFYGMTPDSTLIDGLSGSSISTIPNRILLPNSNLSNISPLGDWREWGTWITGSVPWATIVDSGRGAWNPYPIRSTAGGTKAAYVRPTIECNSPAGTTSTTQIDYIEFFRRVDADPGNNGLVDGNFGASNGSVDVEHWYSPAGPYVPEYSGGSKIYPLIVEGAGQNGGNALWFDVLGSGFDQEFVYNRHAIRMANTVTVSVRYRFANVTTVSGSASLVLWLVGIRPSGDMPRHYETIGGSPPTQSVTLNTLTGDGNWHVTTLTFSSLFANSYLEEADYVQLQLQLVDGGTDDFELYVGRIGFARA